MAANTTNLTPKEYILGHLPNLAYDFKEGRFLTNEEVMGQQGSFYTLHIDTLLMSLALGLASLGFLAWVASKATTGTPGRLQGFIEMLLLFIQDTVKSLFPNPPKIVAPLALTIFVWAFFMNLMDLVPVDIVAVFGGHFKLVPTTDVNATFAMSLTVFAMVIYYNFKSKGPLGFFREVCVAPFGNKWFLWPANIFMRLVEELAKPVSLALRLFGNLFAAEMIFLLIALLPFYLQWLAGGPWAIYHILVVPLQAFIFTALTVVYINLAHEDHSKH